MGEMGGQASGHAHGVNEGEDKLQIEYLWVVALQIRQPLEIEDWLAHIVVGFSALVLFSMSLYAWSRRRNFGLLLVSFAFLLFCLKEVLWILSEEVDLGLPMDLVRVLLDLVVLGLFFVAIAHKPRKQLE